MCAPLVDSERSAMAEDLVALIAGGEIGITDEQ